MNVSCISIKLNNVYTHRIKQHTYVYVCVCVRLYTSCHSSFQNPPGSFCLTQGKDQGFAMPVIPYAICHYHFSDTSHYLLLAHSTTGKLAMLGISWHPHPSLASPLPGMFTSWDRSTLTLCTSYSCLSLIDLLKTEEGKMGLNCDIKNFKCKNKYVNPNSFSVAFSIGYRKYYFEERKFVIMNKTLNGLMKVVQKQIGLPCSLYYLFCIL